MVTFGRRWRCLFGCSLFSLNEIRAIVHVREKLYFSPRSCLFDIKKFLRPIFAITLSYFSSSAFRLLSDGTSFNLAMMVIYLSVTVARLSFHVCFAIN